MHFFIDSIIKDLSFYVIVIGFKKSLTQRILAQLKIKSIPDVCGA